MAGAPAARGCVQLHCAKCNTASITGSGMAYIFAAATLLVALAPHAFAQCDTNCSLNGDCVANACVCDVSWSGSPQCDVLALLPAAPDSGYRNTSGASWGGRPLYDPTDKLWHLMAAQMRNNCSLWTWANNSAVIHATSSDPGGPYKYVEEVLPPFAHNPKLYRVPSWDGGGFLLASIGGGIWNPVARTCTQPYLGGPPSSQWRHYVEAREAPVGAADPTPMNDGCGIVCGPSPLNCGCGIALAWSATLAGPWNSTPLIITDQQRSKYFDCAHSNPTLVWRRDGGGLRMGFNAGYCHGGLETVGIAQAPSWRGPWTLASPDPVLWDSPGVPRSCEDPVLWETSRGWHMIVHIQDTSQRAALYAHSFDGVSNWTLHAESGNPGPYVSSI